MVLPQLLDRSGFTAVNRAEEILCLMFELIQIRTNGKSTIGHSEPPCECPGSAVVGRKEVR